VIRLVTFDFWDTLVTDSPENLRAQRRAHALVGVEAQHPVVACRIDGELLLRAVTRPVALDDPRSEGGRELARAVGGMRIDHDDFVAEADRTQAGFDTLGFVEGDNACRQAAVTRHAHPAVASRKARRILSK